MRPVETPFTNVTLTLPDGTEENDLPAERAVDGLNRACFITTWKPDAFELAQLRRGAAVRLVVWGEGHPPVALSVDPLLVPPRPRRVRDNPQS
jgi:hypothetical protein